MNFTFLKLKITIKKEKKQGKWLRSSIIVMISSRFVIYKTNLSSASNDGAAVKKRKCILIPTVEKIFYYLYSRDPRA